MLFDIIYVQADCPKLNAGMGLRIQNLYHPFLLGHRGLAVMRPACHHRTLFFNSLDTQNFMSEFAEDDFS